MLSPPLIGIYNFALSMLPWLPAVYVFLQVDSDLSETVNMRHPGHDNDHYRTLLSIGVMISGYLACITVWWAGLLLTKGLRCAFS